ncbi:MAG: CrcB family protein [Cryobacterium sp.]
MNGWVLLATVLAGGAAGAARYLTARLWPTPSGRVSRSVLLVNLAGSAVGGAVLGLAERALLSPELSLVLLAGVCGGLTTFSTWSVETIELFGNGHWRAALLNVGLGLTSGLAACALAYSVVRAV